MELSFHEKSLWLTLVSLIACFGYYFATLSPLIGSDVPPSQVARFLLATVVLVIVQIVGHILFAVSGDREETDERDRLIGLIGARNASYVLATGVCLALWVALITKGNFGFTHVLLGSWVLAQIVEIGSQLFLHRRGA